MTLSQDGSDRANAALAWSLVSAHDRLVAGLVEHLESYLGVIQGGEDNIGTPGVNVVWFEPDHPFDGVTTLATLGLSHHHLAQSGARGLHQELLLHVPTEDGPPNAPSVLFQVVTELLGRGYGLRRGEVVGPRGRLFDRGQCTALYAAAPVYLPEGFGAVITETVTVVLTWLVPITTAEAAYVDSHGWEAFEIFSPRRIPT